MRDEFNDYGPVDLGNECRRDYRSRPWDVPMTPRERARYECDDLPTRTKRRWLDRDDIPDDGPDDGGDE